MGGAFIYRSCADVDIVNRGSLSGKEYCSGEGSYNYFRSEHRSGNVAKPVNSLNNSRKMRLWRRILRRYVPVRSRLSYGLWLSKWRKVSPIENLACLIFTPVFRCFDIMSTNKPSKFCFCPMGYFGPNCEKFSENLSGQVDLSNPDYRKEVYNDMFDFYWRPVDDEIEVVIRVS